MTKFKATHKDNTYSIVVDGHATGSTEVCAGISALCYALVGVVDDYDLKVLSMNIYDGHFDIVFEGEIEANCVYDMFTIGLMQIAQSYPLYCGGEIN